MGLSSSFSTSFAVAAMATSCLFAGCKSELSSETGGAADTVAQTDAEISAGDSSDPNPKPKARVYRPVQLGGAAAPSTGSENTVGEPSAVEGPPKFEEVVAALKPIQIVLGRWQGIVRKAARSEVHDWVWDLKTDPVFPALVLSVPKGEFFTKARITYDPRSKKYLMTTVDQEKLKRSFTGEFIKDPEDVPSDDGKTVERTFELQLTEDSDSTRGLRFQYVFQQQHNNRYLVRVERARGKAAFRQFDVIGSQREGVSFAKADDDYGTKTCIISGGLGTMTVSYEGRTFYVCCSGCKAAFDDEPERWIARWEAQKAEKMKSNQ